MASDDRARAVVAMQFAGGMSIARLAEAWDRDAAWVEEAIRHALLETIPQRNGGLKISRTEARAAKLETRSEEEAASESAQGELEFNP